MKSGRVGALLATMFAVFAQQKQSDSYIDTTPLPQMGSMFGTSRPGHGVMPMTGSPKRRTNRQKFSKKAKLKRRKQCQ